MYMNKHKKERLIIFDFIIEACKHNQVDFDGYKMLIFKK